MSPSFQWKQSPYPQHKRSFHPQEKGLALHCLEEIIMAYYEEAVLQDNADSPQESSPPALFSFRSITRLKSQLVPKTVTYEEVYYIPKELLESCNLS